MTAITITVSFVAVSKLPLPKIPIAESSPVHVTKQACFVRVLTGMFEEEYSLAIDFKLEAALTQGLLFFGLGAGVPKDDSTVRLAARFKLLKDQPCEGWHLLLREHVSLVAADGRPLHAVH